VVQPEQFRVVPARDPGRTAGSVVAALAIAAIVWSVLENPRWGWGVFAQWFFSAPVLAGLGRTLLLTFLGALFGFALGTLLAIARVSR
jgi:polar amino acid transport system permease protein